MPFPSRYLLRLGFLYGKGIVHSNVLHPVHVPIALYKLEVKNRNKYILYFRPTEPFRNFSKAEFQNVWKYGGWGPAISMRFDPCLVTEQEIGGM